MDTFASYEIEVSSQKKKKHQIQKENKVMNETNKIGLNCNIKKMSYSILIKVQFITLLLCLVHLDNNKLRAR
jgi:hypothetical protein